MRTTLQKTNRLRLLGMAAILGLGGMTSSVQAQVWDFSPVGVWPYGWYPPYVQNGATAYEGFLRGEAALAQADGERALALARAQAHYEQAVARRLENRERAFEQRLTFRRQGLAQREVEFDAVRSARSTKMALNQAERMLERSAAAVHENETRAEARMRLARSIRESPTNGHVAVTEQPH